MGYKIKKFEDDEIDGACKIALDHHLYIDGWCMEDWYRSSSCLKAIYIGFYNSSPVACLVVRHDTVYWKLCNCGTFVSELHRRKRYGTRLLKKAIKDGHVLYVDKHDHASSQFFTSLKL